MTDDLKISVIVPVYNVERYLDRCVESIASQTYRNLEIILVDDGSPDKSPEMCDVWAKKDSRIKVIHKKNGGLGDARNAGLDVASGD
jgi:glycosyltransferase involved in cell wall biosynthesis